MTETFSSQPGEDGGQLDDLENPALAVLARDVDPDFLDCPLAVGLHPERVLDDHPLPGVELEPDELGHLEDIVGQ